MRTCEGKSTEKSLVPKVRVIFNPDNSYNDDPFGPDKLESAWSKLPPRTENPAPPLRPTQHGMELSMGCN